MWIFLGDGFWNASVFSASRVDSGYMMLPVYIVVGFVSVYSAMLGSTVDTFLRQSMECLRELVDYGS